jgi:ornithine carbamoyltransferase
MMRHFLTGDEPTREELGALLELARRLKRSRGLGRDALRGKSIIAIFEKPSTRTRVSLQVASHELGALCLATSPQELQLGRGETVEDTARVLSRYVHAIAARVFSHQSLERLAAASSVPVINALSDLYHPLQMLADLMTIEEAKGGVEGVAIAWVGDGNNVCNSLMIGAAKLGAEIRVATPRAYRPHVRAVEAAERACRLSGGKLLLTEEPEEAVRGADVVVTDTFVSMGQEAEAEERLRAFLPRYQVNEALLALAKPDAIFMHCLPAKRGYEVTAGVLDGPRSVVLDEAENRLHTSKALLLYLLAPDRARELLSATP